MELSSDRRRVEQYLSRELSGELELLENNLLYEDVDKYTKFLYWRVRELHWTLSRLYGKLRLGEKRPLIDKDPTPPKRLFNGTPAASAGGPRLFLDVTDAARRSKVTGIQRVVHQIARNALETGLGLPVVIEEGRLFSYYRHPSLPDRIDIAEGDHFVMLDAGWNRLSDYPAIMREISSKGGVNIVCLYDIIPLIFSQAFAPALVHCFQDWIENIVLESDALVAISQSTANEFIAYLATSERAPKENFRIGWWPLGADFAGAACGKVSQKALDVVRGEPFFLSVGTLEPRKAYPVVLDAFEELWRSGANVAYVIVGRRGWNARATEKRISEHPEYNRRLFWFNDASDADLRFLYEHARGAVCASFAEGFGLPLIEAGRYGVPVIATDIPVFHEVGGDDVTYFDALDSNALALCLREALAGARRTPGFNVLSWRESAEALLAIVREGKYQLDAPAVQEATRALNR